MDHFIKFLSVFCFETGKVITYELDCDQTGHSNDDGVQAILHSLKKVGVYGKDDD